MDNWPIKTSGLLHDRAFALIDVTDASDSSRVKGAGDRVITLMTHPALALLSVRIDLEQKVLTVEAPSSAFSASTPRSDTSLSDFSTKQAFTHMNKVLVIDLNSTFGAKKDSEHTIDYRADAACTVKVCGQRRSASRLVATEAASNPSDAVTSDADAWFSEFINSTSQKSCKHVRCALVRANLDVPSVSTTGSLTSSPNKGNLSSSDPGTTRNTSFANSAAFLVLTLESIRFINEVQYASA